MADVLIPGAQALSEWFSPVGGLIIGCGEASALVVSHILKGEPLSAQELTDTIKAAIAAGQTVGSNHAQTAANVQWDLQRSGISSTAVYDQGSIVDELKRDAGIRPLILGVSNGAALPGETSGLRGHYVTLVGRGGDGTFLLADPNSEAATHGGFTRATLQQILASQPFAAIEPSGVTGGGNPLSSGTDNGTATGFCIGFRAATGIDLCGIGSNVANGVNAITDPNAGLGAIFGQFYKGAAISLERAGFLLLALTIIAFGVLLLAFPALESGAKTAGKAAALAA